MTELPCFASRDRPQRRSEAHPAVGMIVAVWSRAYLVGSNATWGADPSEDPSEGPWQTGHASSRWPRRRRDSSQTRPGPRRRCAPSHRAGWCGCCRGRRWRPASTRRSESVDQSGQGRQPRARRLRSTRRAAAAQDLRGLRREPARVPARRGDHGAGRAHAGLGPLQPPARSDQGAAPAHHRDHQGAAGVRAAGEQGVRAAAAHRRAAPGRRRASRRAPATSPTRWASGRRWTGCSSSAWRTSRPTSMRCFSTASSASPRSGGCGWSAPRPRRRGCWASSSRGARPSLGGYNTREDLDRLVSALRHL